MSTLTHLKRITMDGLRLCLSPLVGAFAEIRVEMNRPASHSLKQIAKDDIRLYFAPFSGAVAGIKKELSRRVKV